MVNNFRLLVIGNRLKVMGYLLLIISLLVVVPVYGAADQDQLMRDLQNMSNLPMRSTSYMMSNRHLHVTPAATPSMNVPKAQGDVFTYFGSKDMKGNKRVWVADQLFLNGAHLMTTGSRYSSQTELNSSISATTPHPGRPKRLPDLPDPFPDPIGDAMWPLALLAIIYLMVLRVRKRKLTSEGMKE